MINKIKNILIVEDDGIHMHIIGEKVNELGYHNLVKCSTFKEAEEYLQAHTVDFIITDFYLNDNKTAIDICVLNGNTSEAPILVVSTYYEEKVFKQLENFVNIGFLPKTCTSFDISVSVNQLFSKQKDVISKQKLLSFVFVKSGKLIVKLNLNDIEVMHVDGKYLELHTANDRFIIRSTLSLMVDRLPNNFLRISQSSVVNLNHVKSINPDNKVVVLASTEASFSRNFRKKLLNSYYLA